MACVCGIGFAVFGGWPEKCCERHDAEYDSMFAGTQTKTLDQVDNELLECLLAKASVGPYPFLQKIQARAMYRVAHTFGLIRWKGPR